MDHAKFFAELRSQRSAMFGKSLTAGQVNGINAVLAAFVQFGDGDSRSLAYVLASKRHEVGAAMQPVREGFKKTDAAARAYVQRHYGHKGKAWYCWPAGPYGHVYYGRGDVQLTWLDNYQASSADAGVDLVKNPDAMLDATIAARILVKGILDGRWNSKKKGIGFYLHRAKPDLKNARRTVNLTDRWDDVAALYRDFYKAIQAAGGVPTARDSAHLLKPREAATAEKAAEKAVERVSPDLASDTGKTAAAPVAPAGGGAKRILQWIVLGAILLGLLWVAFGNLGE